MASWFRAELKLNSWELLSDVTNGDGGLGDSMAVAKSGAVKSPAR